MQRVFAGEAMKHLYFRCETAKAFAHRVFVHGPVHHFIFATGVAYRPKVVKSSILPIRPLADIGANSSTVDQQSHQRDFDSRIALRAANGTNREPSWPQLGLHLHKNPFDADMSQVVIDYRTQPNTVK